MAYSSNPKISIIIPVYNAEKTLSRCIDSILVQTFRDFELLLIDDGSEDQSGEMCDNYARQDNRVVVFHKENGGVGSARQVGIENVNGQYTIHADSDDYIDANMLSELYACAERTKAGIVYCDFIMEKNGDSHIEKQDFGESSVECIYSMLMHRMHGSLWNKLIATSIFKENRINFIPGVDVWEDLYFSICCFSQHPEISYLDKAYYHYVERDDSLVSSISYRRIEGQILVAQKISILLSDDERFNDGIVFTKLQSKNEYLFYGKTFDSKKWKDELPLANEQIIRAKIPFGKKVFCLLANSGFTFCHKPALLLNQFLKRLVRKTKRNFQ